VAEVVSGATPGGKKLRRSDFQLSAATHVEDRAPEAVLRRKQATRSRRRRQKSEQEEKPKYVYFHVFELYSCITI
jgi:hypothetical protein